ncbi:unnamed protein product [Nezara viridula]|uniref:Uncharacterized protein n=1 Tax=Nezara viridula TaxID=85310 RepID=A0A9P0MQD6_NEZVI|nr:unnamed protein product [Nezara viridula]
MLRFLNHRALRFRPTSSGFLFKSSNTQEQLEVLRRKLKTMKALKATVEAGKDQIKPHVLQDSLNYVNSKIKDIEEAMESLEKRD